MLTPDTWVRLNDVNCDMHPDKGKPGVHREFIGVYRGNYTVDWLCGPLLPQVEHTHWNEHGCLIPINMEAADDAV